MRSTHRRAYIIPLAMTLLLVAACTPTTAPNALSGDNTWRGTATTSGGSSTNFDLYFRVEDTTVTGSGNLQPNGSVNLADIVSCTVTGTLTGSSISLTLHVSPPVTFTATVANGVMNGLLSGGAVQAGGPFVNTPLSLAGSFVGP